MTDKDEVLSSDPKHKYTTNQTVKSDEEEFEEEVLRLAKDFGINDRDIVSILEEDEEDEEDEEEYNNTTSAYRDDALYVTEDTRIDDIVTFLRSSIESPIFVGDRNENIVWNFSTHEVDTSVLDVEGKDCDRFIIPYQVTGTWAFMYQLIPDQLKGAELLVYRKDAGEYYAYRNFFRTTTRERQDQIRYDLSRRLEQISVPEVME